MASSEIRITLMRHCLLGLLTYSIVAATGCNSRNAGPVTYPAAGTVTYQGKPIAGATITFHAHKNGVTAMALTDDAGNFEVRTLYNSGHQEKPGMAEGEYQVTVSKLDLESIKSTFSPPKDLLPKKYTSPTSSPLTATVSTSGENRYSFSLQ
jgi:hypothetical protein